MEAFLKGAEELAMTPLLSPLKIVYQPVPRVLRDADCRTLDALDLAVPENAAYLKDLWSKVSHDENIIKLLGG